MFEDALLETSRSRLPALVSSYVLQFILLSVLVLVPLLHMEALPTWWFTRPLVPPPSGASSARSPSMRKVRRHASSDEALKEPPFIPKTIAQIQEAALPPPEGAGIGPIIPGAIPGGGTQGVPFGLGENAIGLTRPPPPPQAKPVNARPLRVGGNVSAAKLIYHPHPEYPALAKMAHVQGTVVLEAIIGKGGTIQDLKVMSGPALLVRAAVEAVERWRYQPTLLNGEAVEVLTEISVKFTLAD